MKYPNSPRSGRTASPRLMTRCGQTWPRSAAIRFSGVVSMASPPLETASDCPGQEVLDKASYVGLYRPCLASALAPRQLLKNTSPALAKVHSGPTFAEPLRELLGSL